MKNIKPIRLHGNWNEGFSLDFHTISSVYLGRDETGYEQFETTRTVIGDLLYRLKYNNDISALDDIMKLVEPFLCSWGSISKVDVILAIPPTDQNRSFQPVFEIAKRIGEYLKKRVYTDVLIKEESEPSKNLPIDNKTKILNTVMMKRNAKKAYNILIIDDLHQTGATLNAAVKALRTDSNIKSIYVFTLTKSRR